MQVIIAIIVFGVIIAIHEFGHFIVAKLCNIRVNEFAIGMGPALIKRSKGETLYALRAIPIGGYVKMEGEDESSDDDRAFNKKPVYQRMLVVVAGAVMNILLGFIIILIATLMSDGISTTVIASFNENATSHESGLKVDDKILKINGRRMFVDADIVYELLNDEDGITQILVERNGEKVNLDNVKFDIEKNEDGTQSINFDFMVYGQKKTFTNVVKFTADKTVSTARIIWLTLTDLLKGKYGINDLSGPIGVVDAIGQASSMGLLQLLALASFITINVGIFNLLPIPALDGGRIVFLIIEGIRRRPIKPEYEGYVHFIGLALLLLLMVIVSISDVVKLF
ncbi:MAG: RIP metalloprotease RseP [Clostridiales bacterium]|nr:RIP metalloprotease RseP [Clostridiales bacterium]